jgi:CRP-like cAMP-binding protein
MISELEQRLPQLVREFGRRHLESLFDGSAIVEFSAGSAIIEDKQSVDSLYLIVDGVVVVSVDENGESIRLGRLGAGQWFGEVSMLSGEPIASSTVAAETGVKLLRLPHRDFERLNRDHDEAAAMLVKHLTARLAERLRASNAALKQGPDGRLALKGSDKIIEYPRPVNRNWLEKIFRKLTGVEGAA